MSPRTIDDPTAAAVSCFIGASVCAMTPAVKSECMLSIGKNLSRVCFAFSYTEETGLIESVVHHFNLPMQV